jgi:Tfp pilus assembly protein FimT
MLVVIGIILVLASISLAFIPTGLEKQRVRRGASLLQGWLATARQWALRDQAPRGLRLQPLQATDSTTAVTAAGAATITPTAMSGITVTGVPWSIQVGSVLAVSDANGLNAETVVVTAATATTFTATFSNAHSTTPFPIRVGYVQEAQYVEQPDNWSQTGNLAFTFSSGPNPDGTNTYAVAATGGIDFTGGFGATSDPSLWPVQQNDLLWVTANNHFYKIVTVSATSLSVWGDPTWNGGGAEANPTTSYKIVRQPRVRAGESALQLPSNVVVDLNTNSLYGNSLPSTGYIDVLFRPDGAVYYWGGSGNKIHLWLRDLSQDPVAGSSMLFNGEQILVTVYIRTGMISTDPVAEALNSGGTAYANPYSFTQDGRSSGL